MSSKSKLLIIIGLAATVTVGGLASVAALLAGHPRPQVTASGEAAIGGPFTLVATDSRTVPIRPTAANGCSSISDTHFAPTRARPR